MVLRIVLLFLSVGLINASENMATPPDKQLIFNPSANPTYNFSPINEVKPNIICSSMSSAVASSIFNYTTTIFEGLKSAATKDNYEQLKTALSQYFWDNSYAITKNVILGTYGITSAMLVYDYSFMHDSQRWVQWKSIMSFEALCSTPQQQLTKELIIDITQRNYNTQNPTDAHHPLIMFIQEINKEEYRIKRYIKIASLLKKIRVIRIFPVNELKIKQAENLLTRLLFIKHLFLTWLTDYNLERA